MITRLLGMASNIKRIGSAGGLEVGMMSVEHETLDVICQALLPSFSEQGSPVWNSASELHWS